MKKPHFLVCAFGLILLLFLQCLFMRCNGQPTDNICDSARLENQIVPQNVTATFDWGTKTLSINSVDTPAGYEVTKYVAWKVGGNNRYLTSEVWGGLQCDNFFYDYYLNPNTRAELDAYVRYYLIMFGVRARDLRGEENGFIFYRIRARNALGYYSQVFTTQYLQP